MEGKKIVSEQDVYLTVPKTKLYIVSDMCKPAGEHSELLDLVSVKRKPMQEKLELEYQGIFQLYCSSEISCSRSKDRWRTLQIHGTVSRKYL